MTSDHWSDNSLSNYACIKPNLHIYFAGFSFFFHLSVLPEPIYFIYQLCMGPRQVTCGWNHLRMLWPGPVWGSGPVNPHFWLFNKLKTQTRVFPWIHPGPSRNCATLYTPPTMLWKFSNAASTSFFPSKKDSKLIEESNYMVWVVWMQTVYHIAGLWDITSKDCWPLKNNTSETAIWKKKNLVALGLLQSSLNDNLIMLTTHETHVFCVWQMLKLQMSHKGSGSILLWFHQLICLMNLGSDISEHITHFKFQEALWHLIVAG